MSSPRRSPLVWVQLGVTNHLDRCLVASHIEGYQRAFHRDHLADRLHQISDRTTQPAGVDAQESIFPRLRRVLADVYGGAPVASENVAWHVGKTGNGRAGNVDASDIAVEMPSHHCVADATVGVFSDPARTEKRQLQTSSKRPSRW